MVTKAKMVKGNLEKYGLTFGELVFTEELENFDGYDKNHGVSSVHRKESNITELVFYLEELYKMDGLDSTEKEIYERYQWGMKVEPSEWLYVYRNAHDLNYEQF